MIYILHFFIAIGLFSAAFCGAINSNLVRKIPLIGIFYYVWSLVGQIFALPLMLLTIASLFFALYSQLVPWLIMLLSAASLVLYTMILVDSWIGSKALSKVAPNGNKASVLRFLIGSLFPIQLPRRDVKRLKNIAYGPAGRRNTLDIYMPQKSPVSPMPVLIHVHGGAWTLGRKHQQAQPLIQYMASKGWLVVDINYRLAPRHKMPVMIQDVLRAVAWVKANIASYNGDPQFVALTGGSAGGHLVALAALAANHEPFKPGFEHSDCSVNACVPVYGLYDFLNRNKKMKVGLKAFQSFLTKLVMPGSPTSHEAFWDEVSPLSYVRSDAPPMLMLHGRHDLLANFDSAKGFAETLAQSSNNPVIFAEMRGAQHGYDIAYASPTPEHQRAIYRFLESARANGLTTANSHD
jgi:acetyl esterase/lipase